MTRLVLSCALSLSILLAGCSGDENKSAENKSADQGNANTKTNTKTPIGKPNDTKQKNDSPPKSEPKNDIVLQKEGKIQFRENIFSNVRDLRNEIDLKSKSPFAIVVEDPQAKFEHLQNLVREMQMIGELDLELRSGETNVPIPYPAAASESELNLMKISIASSSKGEFSGLKIDLNGQVSWSESSSIDHSTKFAGTRIDLATTCSGTGEKATLPKLEIELSGAPNLPATDFLEVCKNLFSHIESSRKKSAKINFWPLGYPSEETPPELNLEINRP